MTIYAMKIYGMDNPMGQLLEGLEVSWKAHDTTGKRQTWAKVEVATD